MKEPYTLAILAGGQSRRMGTDKAALAIGEESFLQHLAGAFPDAAEILVSVASKAETPLSALPVGARLIGDDHPGQGPLAGLQKVLAEAETDLVFAVACDMPLMDEGFAERLLGSMPEGAAAVLPRESSGRVHPLAAWYRKAAEPAARHLLETGERRMTALAEALDAAYCPVPEEAVYQLRNINTPADYLALRAGSVPVFSFAGVSGTGKTTLIETLVERLAARGIATACVKHTHHEISLPEGKDSTRFTRAGAAASLVVNEEGAVMNLNREMGLREAVRLAAEASRADVVLVEGFKDETGRQIWLEEGRYPEEQEIEEILAAIEEEVRKGP